MYQSLPSDCGKNIRTPRVLPSALAVVVLGAWFITCAALGATIPAPYELATWRGFRASAVSYTFDDNSPKQFSVAQPMFDARGLHATFFCIVGNLSSSQWTTIESASAKGHEIASHTLTHPDLAKLTSEQVTTEESDSKTLIETHTGKKCVSLAYPYCTVPNKSITSQYYAFARSCNGAFVAATPPDFLSIGALGPETGMDIASDTVAGSGLWLVWLIHGIDDDAACCPTASETLKSNLNHVAADSNKWWVETFGNVCRYIQERNAAVLTVVSEESTHITLRLTDNLDDTVFNYPLTLRRPMPEGWPTAAITQNGVPVPSRIVNGNLMFDVVPNGGDIILAKAEAPPSTGAAHLVNVSIRTTAGTNANTLIAGFVLAGTGTKPVLLRGIGPTLADYQVTDPLADPSIVLYNNKGTELDRNDNWGGTTALTTAFASLGAFHLSASSKDAALISSLSAGPYTMHVTTSNATSGAALAEVYDADTSTTDLHLVNISGRGAVDASSNLIAGFVVGGESPMNVLVRAVGPTLTDYNVTGVLSNPKVTLYNSKGAELASNDDWGGATTLSSTFTAVGAFQLPAASKDAAIQMTLNPGPYTAVVSSANGGTGVALVEVYAVE
jgi:oligosaccharide reducing-end xylanase